MPRTVKVLCSFTIDIEIPADINDEDIYFFVEEHDCPGTGFVGAAIDAHIATHKSQGTCWACALGGSNKVIGVQETE